MSARDEAHPGIVIDDADLDEQKAPTGVSCGHKKGRCGVCEGACRLCDCSCPKRPKGRPRKTGAVGSRSSKRARRSPLLPLPLRSLLPANWQSFQTPISDLVGGDLSRYPSNASVLATIVDRLLARGTTEDMDLANQVAAAIVPHGDGSASYADGDRSPSRHSLISTALTGLIGPEELQTCVNDAVHIPFRPYKDVIGNKEHRGRLRRVLRRVQKAAAKLMLSDLTGYEQGDSDLQRQKEAASSRQPPNGAAMVKAAARIIGSKEQNNWGPQQVAYALLSVIPTKQAVFEIQQAAAEGARGATSKTIERNLIHGKKRLSFILLGVDMPETRRGSVRHDERSVQLAVKVILSDDSVNRLAFVRRSTKGPGSDLPIGALHRKFLIKDIYAMYEQEHKAEFKNHHPPVPILGATSFREITNALTGGGRVTEARQGLDYIKVNQHEENFKIVDLIIGMLKLEDSSLQKLQDMRDTVYLFVKHIYKTHVRADLANDPNGAPESEEEQQVLRPLAQAELLRLYNEFDVKVAPNNPPLDSSEELELIENVRSRLAVLVDDGNFGSVELKHQESLHTVSHALGIHSTNGKVPSEPGSVRFEKGTTINCTPCRAVFLFYDQLRRHTLEQCAGNAATASDLLTTIHQCEQRTARFMAHVVRDEVQSAGIRETQTSAETTTAHVTFDYKQKWNSVRHREGSDEYYGKRGISWFGIAVRYHSGAADESNDDSSDDGDGDCDSESGNCTVSGHWMTRFVDIIVENDQSQDWFAAASCLEASLSIARQVIQDTVKNLTLLSDNARNFSNYNLLRCVPHVCSRAGWTLTHFMHNEPACGKASADTHFAHQQMSLERHINSNKGNATSPMELYSALQQCTVRDTTVALIKIDAGSLLAKKMKESKPGISSVKHTTYHENGADAKLSSLHDHPQFRIKPLMLDEELASLSSLSGVQIVASSLQASTPNQKRTQRRRNKRADSQSSPTAMARAAEEQMTSRLVSQAEEDTPRCSACKRYFASNRMLENHRCKGDGGPRTIMELAISYAKNEIATGKLFTPSSNSRHLSILFQDLPNKATTFESNFICGWGLWKSSTQPRCSPAVMSVMKEMWSSGAVADKRNRFSAAAVHSALKIQQLEGTIRLHELPVPSAVRSRYQGAGEGATVETVGESKSCADVAKLPRKVLTAWLQQAGAADVPGSKEEAVKAVCEAFGFPYATAQARADPTEVATCSDKRVAVLSNPVLIAYIHSKEPQWDTSKKKKADLVQKVRSLRKGMQ